MEGVVTRYEMTLSLLADHLVLLVLFDLLFLCLDKSRHRQEFGNIFWSDSCLRRGWWMEMERKGGERGSGDLFTTSTPSIEISD